MNEEDKKIIQAIHQRALGFMRGKDMEIALLCSTREFKAVWDCIPSYLRVSAFSPLKTIKFKGFWIALWPWYDD